MHKDVYYGGIVISNEYYCSNCGYVAMRYSHLIYDLRARPYEAPQYNYCPNCGESMEEEK
jgi:ribosomal protein S27AE